MKNTALHHEHPDIMNARYIAEVNKLNYQQRFEKFISIYELSYKLRTAKRYSLKNKSDEQTNS
jgi:hypothetical protein